MANLPVSKLSSEDKKMLVSIINRLGSGDHPVADVDTLQNFNQDYVQGLVQLVQDKKMFNADGLQRLQKIASLIEGRSAEKGMARLQEAMSEPVVKTVPYKGFTITVTSVISPRFGKLFKATNDIGEPYIEHPYFDTVDKAVNWDKKNIDQYVAEQ